MIDRQLSPTSQPSIRVARTIAEVRALVALARQAGRTIGLVPTMGALHAGHRSLVDAARRSTGFVVVSVFVNPTQFGPTEDLSRYPRTWDADVTLCTEGGADLIFAPDVLEVYPSGQLATFVEVPDVANVLEGASRPGHFRGVATVVLKLFGMVGPDVAFFGAKDYQQQLLIRRLVHDLDVPVRIATEPTVRDEDGLALSSRNRYLSDAERRTATVLYRSLRSAQTAVAAGEQDANRIRQGIQITLESEPGVALDTVDVVDADTLAPVLRIEPGHRVVALIAARVGPARLIDNIWLSG